MKSVLRNLLAFVSGLVIALPAPTASLAATPPANPLAPPEITGETVYVPFPVQIKLDGQLDDWVDVPVQTVDRGPSLSPDPAQTGVFTFAVAADTKNFYITMRVPDAQIITGQHEQNFWNEDSLEFYLNQSADLNADSYTAGIFQANINPGDSGNTDPKALTLTGEGATTAGIQGFVFKTATGWGFEAAVPLKTEPKHGLEIGFQAQVNGASQADRDTKLIWSKADKADTSWQDPRVFGRAVFFEVGQTEIPTPSPLATATLRPTRTPTPVPLNSAVRVNQVGYYPYAPKIAVYVTDSTTAVEWALQDRQGQTVLTGQTIPLGPDEASGDNMQHIDFSSYTTPGTGYQLSVGSEQSPPFDITATLYQMLKTDALRYFYLNRSGLELTEPYAGAWARRAGHLSDQAVTCYAGADSTGKEWPACAYTLDASGGWYDAGDYGKYVVNGGISVWTLMNAYEHNPAVFKDGALNIPESQNGVPDILDEARWELEFLLRMQVPAGQPMAGMVHHKLHGLTWDSMPGKPQTESGSRYLFPPSTAATLNLAATAAQGARIWKTLDPEFSAQCLAAAETAWQAAQANPAVLAAVFPTLGGGPYDDSQVTDEFYWAAVELYITTQQATYKDFLLASSHHLETGGLYWGGTAPLGTLSLAVVPNALPEAEISRARDSIVQFANQQLSHQSAANNGYRVPLTPAEYVWGSNSGVLNNALLIALAYDFTDDPRYLSAVAESMNYLLGRNTLQFSYISGYGENALTHPHHRFWGNQPPSYPPPPPGVVAGGPNGDPSDPAAKAANLPGQPPARCYIDNYGSWSTNEVTINWNAPLAWVAAYLADTGRPVFSAPLPAVTPGAPATATVPATPTPAAVFIPVVGGGQSPAQPANPFPWGWVTVIGLGAVAILSGLGLWLRRRR